MSPSKPSYQPSRATSSHTDDKGKARLNAEVVVLSDSDDDEGQVKRELSPSNSRSLDSMSFAMHSQGNQGTSQLASEVIDLTLSDDEDDPGPAPAPPPPPPPAPVTITLPPAPVRPTHPPLPPARTTHKRTADAAELEFNNAWKKNRTQHVQPQPATSPQPQMGYLNRNSDARIDQGRTLAPLAHLTATHHSRTPPNHIPYRQPLTESRHLPPPPPLDSYDPYPRPNGMHPNPNHWP